jgi:hypothetical protein
VTLPTFTFLIPTISTSAAYHFLPVQIWLPFCGMARCHVDIKSYDRVRTSRPLHTVPAFLGRRIFTHLEPRTASSRSLDTVSFAYHTLRFPVHPLTRYISFDHPIVGMTVLMCIRAVFRGCLLSSVSFSISRVVSARLTQSLDFGSIRRSKVSFWAWLYAAL